MNVNDDNLISHRAAIEIEGDAGHTTIRAHRGSITQQLDLTQGEVIDLWRQIGIRYNLAGMRDNAQAASLAERGKVRHLELIQQGGRQHLITHLANPGQHHADLVLDRGLLLGRTTDDLLRKHAELHKVRPS